MWALLTPKLWIGIAVAAALAFTHGFAYRSGRAAVRVEWDKERAEMMAATLEADKAARSKEQVLNEANARVTNDYLVQKKLRASDSVVNDGRLRDLRSTILADKPNTNSNTIERTDDPRDSIIDQCATALIGLDQYSKDLALKTIGLQRYSESVCLAK